MLLVLSASLSQGVHAKIVCGVLGALGPPVRIADI